MSGGDILVIGASGGIGRAVVDAYSSAYPDATVFAVSRKQTSFSQQNVDSQILQTDNEEAIAHWCEAHRQRNFRFVIGCMGMLHSNGDFDIAPEKRLEDLNATQLAHYFAVNSIVPALWIKHLVHCVSKQASTVCFLSARVGSISDNALGGWYGYRASKSALNMLIKTASIEYRRRTKHTAFVCYHPGTVDTALSKPFQANVKPTRLFEASYTASRLFSILQEVDVEAGPYYLDWDGKAIHW